MGHDMNDRYLAAYIAAYGADDLKGRSRDEITDIRAVMECVEEAKTDEIAACFLLSIGYQSINMLDAVRRMRSSLGIPAPMSDADRVQVALSTAEARVEELEKELSGLRAYLTRSITNDLGEMDEAFEILGNVSAQDREMVDAWTREMSDPAHWSEEVAELRAALTDLVDRCDRSELADGTSIDTLTAHVALGHIVKEPTDAR